MGKGRGKCQPGYWLHDDQMTDQSFKNKTWKTLLKGFKMWAKTVCGEIFGSLNEVTWTVNGPDDPFVFLWLSLNLYPEDAGGRSLKVKGTQV